MNQLISKLQSSSSAPGGGGGIKCAGGRFGRVFGAVFEVVFSFGGLCSLIKYVLQVVTYNLQVAGFEIFGSHC